jgi:hypothetical protein
MGDDSPNTPLALVLIAGAALCTFMALRSWPQSGSAAVRPEAYAQSIISGDPLPPGPAPTNNTQAIELGLGAILSVWALSKIAGLFSSFPSFFGDEGTGSEGTGDEGTGEGGDEEPPAVENPGGAPPGDDVGGEIGEILGDLG